MAALSTPRKKADELLLAASGDGWVDRETVVQEMMRFVMPGQAHRTVALHRKPGNDDDPRRRDPVRVGARAKANQLFQNALKYGFWEYDRELKRVRHRDHPGVTALVVVEPVAEDIPDPELVEGGFVVPPLEQVKAAVAARSLLESFTKWHLAAIVLTHVEVDDHGGDKTKSSLALSTAEFAALGVIGLRSKDTVRKFHAIALQHWGRRLEPGETIHIPDKDTWPTAKPPTPGTLPKLKAKQQKQPRAPSVRVDDVANMAGQFVAWHGDRADAMARQFLAEVHKRTGTNRRNRLKVVR